MDILSHAAAGAATGAAFGRPVWGALIAVVPDIPIFGPRRRKPSVLYKMTHTLLFVLIAAVLGAVLGVGWLVFFCLLSHLTLDIPTHGMQWAPRVLYPYSHKPLLNCGEWEFFNRQWFVGLGITIGWIITWLLLAY